MKRFTEETIYYAEYRSIGRLNFKWYFNNIYIFFNSNFYIDDEASNYRLHYGDYSGNAGINIKCTIIEKKKYCLILFKPFFKFKIYICINLFLKDHKLIVAIKNKLENLKY